MLPFGYIIAFASTLFFILVIVISDIFERKHLVNALLIKGDWLIKISEKFYGYIRLIVYILALAWAVLVYFFTSSNYPDAWQINLLRFYGLTAFFLFFLVLTPGLLRVYLPTYPLNSLFLQSRRAMGLSTFGFAFLHALLAFIYVFSGRLENISKLESTGQLGVLMGVIALTILFFMAVTSTNLMVKMMTFKWWKNLHRLIYITVILSTLHAFLRGPHFNMGASIFPAFIIFLTLTYILLEAGATAIEWSRTYKLRPVIVNILCFGALAILVLISYIVCIIKLNSIF